MDGSAAPARLPARPARGAPRRLRWTLPVLAALLVSACATGLLYNRIDWAVSWYVDGLVSLDPGQERLLRDSVRRTMAWHRQTQLSRYTDLLQRLAADAGTPVTAVALEAYYQETTVFLRDFLAQAAPDAARLLGSLEPRQVDELAANLEADSGEMWAEYGGETPEIRQNRRLRNATRSIQRFVGSLNGAQRHLVEERLAAMQDLSGAWMERRRNWQEQLLRLLQAAGRGQDFDAGIRSLLVDPDQFDAAAYRQAVEANRRVVLGMLAELSVTLTAAQREHLRKKFLEYAEDLRRIAAAG